MRKIIVLVSAAALLVGCSSSKQAATRASNSPAGGTSSSPFTTTYGQDAALLAGHIPGCAGVAAEQVPSTATGITSEASCTMLGHKVLLYTWTDSTSQQSGGKIIGGAESSYAEGTGWDEIPADSAGADAQKAIAEKVASALGGYVNTGG